MSRKTKTGLIVISLVVLAAIAVDQFLQCPICMFYFLALVP